MATKAKKPGKSKSAAKTIKNAKSTKSLKAKSTAARKVTTLANKKLKTKTVPKKSLKKSVVKKITKTPKKPVRTTAKPATKNKQNKQKTIAKKPTKSNATNKKNKSSNKARLTKKAPASKAKSVKKVSPKSKVVAKPKTKPVAKKSLTSKKTNQKTNQKAKSQSATGRKSPIKKQPSVKTRTPHLQVVPNQKVVEFLAIADLLPPTGDTYNPTNLAGLDIPPYKERVGEPYMNDSQQAHFRKILLKWKDQLLEEMSRTVHHLQEEAVILPDPNDRASQEEEFSLELRARDRERKLIKKIEEALQKIEEGSYGYCDSCGIEIGIRRLEARPTANLCIDCKTLDEIRERQMGG